MTKYFSIEKKKKKWYLHLNARENCRTCGRRISNVEHGLWLFTLFNRMSQTNLFFTWIIFIVCKRRNILYTFSKIQSIRFTISIILLFAGALGICLCTVYSTNAQTRQTEIIKKKII